MRKRTFFEFEAGGIRKVHYLFRKDNYGEIDRFKEMLWNNLDF